MSLLFIVNPIAGKGRAKGIIPVIERYLNNSNKKYEILITKEAGQATEFTIDGLTRGYKKIIAVGGDGTINEVNKGLISKGYGILGIIPAGTGNDLARTLKISEDPIKALDLIIKGTNKKINLAEVKGNIFLNVASVGFDAEIVENVKKIKRYLRSKFAYTLGLLKTLITYKYKHLDIVLDNKEIKEKVLLVAVANGKYYGGGMKICPKADIEDEYLHVCLIKKLPKLKLFFIFPSVFKGTHIKYNKYVSFHKTKNLKIKSKEDAMINIDGDIIKGDKEVNFRISDKKVNVICN
ncbi:MAG: diacylglycerol kinase family lipid kinase [Firmicutes bacterium]|nr:diacylglycerol kinase family lipid kinase [Bacillota bacterium]